MKDISFRPTKLILSLFEQIRKLEHLPNSDRNSIVHRAMEMALKNKNLDWQFISAMTVEEDGFVGSIPKHVVLKVDEEKFSLINEQIKAAFEMEKITIPYTLKLLLVNYLASFSQTNVTDPQIVIPGGVDLTLFKHDYAGSAYIGKRRLLEACQAYLKANPKLHNNLSERTTHQYRSLTKLHDFRGYFPDHDNNMGVETPTASYLAKILAGWLIFTVESQYEAHAWNSTLDHIVKGLEGELQIKNESPLEKIRAKKDAESADYYKNVYARMMSR